jgi:hypothetical protein
MRRLIILSAVCLLAINSAPAQAQSGQVGVLTKIRGLKVAPPCPPSREADNSRKALQIVRGSDTLTVTALQLDQAEVPVQMLDQIVVPRSSDARLLIRSGDASGLFVLAPDFGRCGEKAGRDDYPGSHSDAAKYGIYKIGTRRDSGSGKVGLQLSVDVGAITAEWAHGLVFVYALAKPLVVNGTEFAVLVDSSAGRAFLYVRSGRVQFEGIPELVATQRQLFTWKQDSIPRLVVPLPAKIEKEFLFHAKELWQGTPVGVKIGGVVLGGAVAIALLLPRPSPKPGLRNRTVVVGLPL